MTKKDLIKDVAAVLKQKDVRKPVYAHRQVFHISDDYGNKKDFVVSKKGRGVMYTVDDVETIIDYTLAVIEEALKRGEPITIRGFGTLAIKYRKARATRNMQTGERIAVEGRYLPKFQFGSELRECAKYFELSQQDALSGTNDAEAESEGGDE